MSGGRLDGLGATPDFCHGLLEPAVPVSGRRLSIASGLCLGVPLAGLVAGSWLADTLTAGGAWWAVLLFLGASAAVTRVGSRVDAWMLKASG